jgi:hypothetical protein
MLENKFLKKYDNKFDDEKYVEQLRKRISETAEELLTQPDNRNFTEYAYSMPKKIINGEKVPFNRLFISILNSFSNEWTKEEYAKMRQIFTLKKESPSQKLEPANANESRIKNKNNLNLILQYISKNLDFSYETTSSLDHQKELIPFKGLYDKIKNNEKIISKDGIEDIKDYLIALCQNYGLKPEETNEILEIISNAIKE